MNTEVEKAKKILEEMKKLKASEIQIAKEDLRKALKPLDVELVSFDFKKSLLWNIKLKLKRPFHVSYADRNMFGFLTGEVFHIETFLERHETNYSAPGDDEDAKEWAEDLYDAFDTWMLKHGSFLQTLLGEEPKYPQKGSEIRYVKNKLKRYGKIGSIILKIGLNIFGAGFFFLFFKTMEAPNLFWEGAQSDMERLKRVGSSQASWSILSSGVSQARVEAHIIRLTVNQLLSSLEKSPLKDEVYKHIGDNLQALPKNLAKLERSLDRTNYALITMGGDWYRQRLVHEDREMVELASKFNPMPIPSNVREASFLNNATISALFNKSDYLMELLKKLEKKEISAADKQNMRERLEKKLEYWKNIAFDKAEEALAKDLERYNLTLVRFSACKRLKSNITIRNENGRKYTLNSLLTWAKKKAKAEEVKVAPENYYKDLVFTIDEWMFFHGSRLQRIIGEAPLDYNKAESTFIKTMVRLLRLSASKAKLLIKTIFMFFDHSTLGSLFALFTFKEYFTAGQYQALLVAWLVSLIVVGSEKAMGGWKRFLRL